MIYLKGIKFRGHKILRFSRFLTRIAKLITREKFEDLKIAKLNTREIFYLELFLRIQAELSD